MHRILFWFKLVQDLAFCPINERPQLRRLFIKKIRRVLYLGSLSGRIVLVQNIFPETLLRNAEDPSLPLLLEVLLVFQRSQLSHRQQVNVRSTMGRIY